MRNQRAILSAVCAIAMAAGAAVALAAPPRSEVAVIAVEGDLDAQGARALVKQIEAAVDRHSRFVVLEIDARAPDPEPVRWVTAALSRVPRDMESIAFITGQGATGAAPLVALACDRIAIEPGAALGPCAPAASPELAAELARAAGARGYPEAVAAALGGRPGDVLRVTIEDVSGLPVDHYYHETRIPDLDASKLSTERLYGSDLARIEGKRAQRLGLARWVAPDRNELVYALQTGAGDRLAVVEIGSQMGGFERFLSAVTRRGLLPLFLFLGLLGIAIEISHPSLVVPGALGVVCLAIALSGGHLAGLTSAFDLCLIVGGIVLLLLEMFVIPGFGAAGIAGILCLLAGAFLALQESPWPRTEAQMAEWREGAKTFALGLTGTIAGFALALRLLPASPILRRLVHTSSQSVEDGYTVAPPSRVAFLGRTGVAATDLRPAGKVAIEDEVVDATSDGKWIERGAAVEVIETSENRLVVRKKA
jgi:membrane-bound serine protease (ClpP class)